MMLKLFLIYDDVEEFLVAAGDANDAYKVIEEEFGPEAADELACSRLREYPADFVMPGSGQGVPEIVGRGRRLVAWGVPGGEKGWRFPRPESFGDSRAKAVT